MSKTWRIGTRGSKLALIQTNLVINRIKELYPNDKFDIVPISSKGDILKNLPISKIDGDGIFVSEIEKNLKLNSIDIAVHSLKDVPTTADPDFDYTVICQRANPCDVLITKNGEKLTELKPGSIIGTSSPRRIKFVSGIRKDINFTSMRGNIETRISKVGYEVDGIVLAAAGIIRLGMESVVSEYFDVNTFLPAAGQGTLCVEFLAKNDEIRQLLLPLKNINVYYASIAERAFMREINAGCNTASAVIGTVNDNVLTLSAMYGNSFDIKCEQGNLFSAESIGIRLARKILDA